MRSVGWARPSPLPGRRVAPGEGVAGTVTGSDLRKVQEVTKVTLSYIPPKEFFFLSPTGERVTSVTFTTRSEALSASCGSSPPAPIDLPEHEA